MFVGVYQCYFSLLENKRRTWRTSENSIVDLKETQVLCKVWQMWLLPKKDTVPRTRDIRRGYCNWSREDKINYGMAYP